MVSSFTSTGGGTYTLEYTTAPGYSEWPWLGLRIEASLVDTSGKTVSLAATEVPGSSFVNVGPSAGRAHILVDIDEDGDVDVGRLGAPFALHTNTDGAGVEFVDETATLGVAPLSDMTCLLTTDATGDGRIDIAFCSFLQFETRWYTNTGLDNPRFDSQVYLGGGRGYAAASVYTAPDSLSFGVWQRFSSGSAGPYYLPSNSHNNGPGVLLIADFNDDTRPDLFLGGEFGPRLYMDLGSEAVPTDSLADRGLGEVTYEQPTASDVDNDGDLDLIVSPPATLYENDGTAHFTRVETGLHVDPTAAGHCRALDFELDGDIDLVCGTNMWVNAGGAAFQQAAASAYGLADAAGAQGDLNGDGDPDWYVASGVIHSTAIRPSVVRYVVVRTVTAAGAPAVFGATVRVTCVVGCPRAWVGTRYHDGTSASAKYQDGYDLVFGLPQADATYNITVTWPQGSPAVSGWWTHPGLGGFVPTDRTPVSRLVVVRPVGSVSLVFGRFPQWDHAAVGTRLGLASRDPTPADTVTVSVVPSVKADGLLAHVATLNGVDASGSWATAKPVGRQYTVAAQPAADDVLWPYTGLEVEVEAVDAAGLRWRLETSVVPGTEWAQLPVVRLPGGVRAVAPQVTAAVATEVGVVVAVRGGPNVVLVDDGTGTGGFVDVAAERGLTGGVVDTTVDVVHADLNGDGRHDVYFVVDGGANQLWLQADNMTFVSGGGVLGVVGGGGGVAVGYLTATPWLDVVVCTGAATVVFTGDGSGAFSDSTGVSNLGAVPCLFPAVLPVDDVDVADDVVLVTATSVVLGVNVERSGVFVDQASARGLVLPDGDGVPSAVLVVDLNHDGALDVYIPRGNASDVVFWGDGAGLYTVEALQGSEVGCRGRVAVVDAQLDGNWDVLPGEAVPGTDVMGVIWGMDPQGRLSAPVADADSCLRPPGVSVPLDIDGDGDADVLHLSNAVVYRSHNAHPSVPKRVDVSAVSASGARVEYGAVIRLECEAGCARPWASVRIVDATAAYDAMFSVPWPSATYVVRVAFPDGGVHDSTTQPALAGVAPPVAVTVPNLPYLTSGVVESPGSGDLPRSVVVPGTVVTVGLTAARGEAGLLPAPQCCFVNGVQARDTFVDVGGGLYTLSYTVSVGDASWPEDGLAVVAPLGSMVPVSIAVGGPSGDPTPPVTTVVSGPPPVTSASSETLCVACPTEAPPFGACNFTFNATSSGVPLFTHTAVTNTTSATSGCFQVGPVVEAAPMEVSVWAVDAAGNVGAATVVGWVKDTIPAVAGFASGPTASPDVYAGAASASAVFELSCSEVGCVFDYRLDGGPWTSLTANSSAEAATGVVVNTTLVEHPARVSAVGNPSVVVGGPVNGTVEVVLDDGVEVWALPLGPSGSAFVPVGNLTQGRHVLSAAASVAGSTDTSPAALEFVVDSLPPTTTLVHVPRDGDTQRRPFVAFVSDEDDVRHMWRSGPVVNGSLGAAPWSASDVGWVRLDGVVAGVTHGLEVYAVDAAGNVGDAVFAAWTATACPAVATVPGVRVAQEVSLGVGARYVALECDDPEWGAFESSLDGAEWVQTPSLSVLLTDVGLGGAHELRLRAGAPPACDALLAAERPPPVVVTWVEPRALPVVLELLTRPAASTPEVFASFVVVPSRPLVWLEYALDGGTWTPCGVELQVGPVQPGGHRVVFRGVDAAGAVLGDVVGASAEWVVTSVQGSTVATAGLPQGDHVLEARAIDAGANVQPVPTPWRWAVDTVRPETTAVRVTPRFSASRTTRVDVGCTETQGACEFCWESASLTNGCSRNSTLVLTAGGEGDHEAAVFARDWVGWEDVSPVVVQWRADTIPPVSALVVLGGVRARSDGVMVTPRPWLTLGVSANEGVSGYDVSVDGAVVAAGAPGPNVTVTELPPGVVRLDVSATDLAGNVEPPHGFAVVVDTAPPGVEVSVPAATPFDSFAVSAVCVDGANGSGCATGEVVVTSPTGAVVLEEVAPFTANGTLTSSPAAGLGEGDYVVRVVALDWAGNVSPTVSATVRVDRTPPVARFVGTVPAAVGTPWVDVVVVADEPCVVWVRSVGRPWVPAGGVVVDPTAFRVANLTEGDTKLEVRAVDVAGNEQAAGAAAADVVVDFTPPAVSWEGGVPTWYTSAVGVPVSVSAVDATPVSFEATVSTNAVATQPSPGAFHVAASVDGNVSVVVTGRDAAGNDALAPVTAWWVVDTVAPTAVLSSGIEAGEGCGSVAGVTVCSSHTAARVVVECADGDPGAVVSPCSVLHAVEFVEPATGPGACASTGRRLSTGSVGTIPLPTDADGLYRVALNGQDAAGNVEPGNATTLTWHVDTAPPVDTVAMVLRPDKTTPSTGAQFVLALDGDASPGQTSLWYRLDDGLDTRVPELPAPTNNAEVGLEFPDGSLSRGSHLVTVWAVDQAGWLSPPTRYSWNILDEAPGVTFVQQPAAVSGDATPVFVLEVAWAANATEGNVTAWEARVEVDLGDGDGFREACTDTLSTQGVCTWVAELVGTGSFTLTARASLVGVSGDPSVYSWAYRECDFVAEFAEIGADGALTCVVCPPGANCAGGLTTSDRVVPVGGHWAPPGGTSLVFYQCPIEEACEPGSVGVVNGTRTVFRGGCKPGYTGVLCGVCDDGYFATFGLCRPCVASKAVAFLMAAGIVVGVVALGAVLVRSVSILPIPLLKITLSMVQIIASANTAYSIPWPPAFSDFLHVLRVFLIEAVSLSRATCAQPMTFFASLALTLVAFKLIVAALIVIPVFLRHSNWAVVFKRAFLFLFVAYPGVSLMIMRVFKCVEVEGEHWLVADMRLRCYEGDWFGYALYAFVMGCLYTGGLPLGIVVILWRHRRRLDAENFRTKWGFLYAGFGVQAYAWEAVELLRKFLLSAFVVLMEEGSPLQVTFAVLVSGWAHVLHSVFKPWKGVGENGTVVYALQHASLFVTAFVFLMGLLFKVEGVRQDGDTYDVAGWVALLACVAFLVMAVTVIVRHMVRQGVGVKPAHVRERQGAELGHRRSMAGVRVGFRGSSPSSVGGGSVGRRQPFRKGFDAFAVRKNLTWVATNPMSRPGSRRPSAAPDRSKQEVDL